MRILISNSSNDPIYTQIYNQIKDAIIKGDLEQGEALPSIRGLAKDLEISVITTKRAYEELERESFIETVQGKGSFVAIKNLELVKEMRLKEIESSLLEVVQKANIIGLSKEELMDVLKIIYEEA